MPRSSEQHRACMPTTLANPATTALVMPGRSSRRAGQSSWSWLAASRHGAEVERVVGIEPTRSAVPHLRDQSLTNRDGFACDWRVTVRRNSTRAPRRRIDLARRLHSDDGLGDQAPLPGHRDFSLPTAGPSTLPAKGATRAPTASPTTASMAARTTQATRPGDTGVAARARAVTP